MLISQHSCGKMESPSDSKIFHGSILLRADCRPPLFSYSGCFKTGVKCLVSKMVTIIFFFQLFQVFLTLSVSGSLRLFVGTSYSTVNPLNSCMGRMSHVYGTGVGGGRHGAGNEKKRTFCVKAHLHFHLG